jgi:nucleoside phosphorylase
MNEVLVCFAVKEEGCFFREASRSLRAVKTVLTRIGQQNAEAVIKEALVRDRPRLVLSCGFAGGLRPELETGTVLFAAEPGSELQTALAEAGAKPGRFYCSNRIITAAAEKQALWKSTGADAVEMESQFICAACKKENVPSVTVRVILDTANEDLPLDFNRLMNARQQMSYGKLAMALMKSPGKIPALLRLQTQTRAAAQILSDVLVNTLGEKRLV